VLILDRGGSGWLGEWVAADLLYASLVALALGAFAGYAFGSFIKWVQPRHVLAPEFDGFLVIGAVLAIYGLAELLDSYGLIAVFAAGVFFRRYELEHEYNLRLHRGATIAKHFGELGVIVLLGTLVTADALGAPGLSGWLIAPLLVLVVRPLGVLLLLSRSTMGRGELVFLAWFGVKGGRVAVLHRVPDRRGSPARRGRVTSVLDRRVRGDALDPGAGDRRDRDRPPAARARERRHRTLMATSAIYRESS
jgi:NhaP-type Na+/H+ or K+/H+ antiporter